MEPSTLQGLANVLFIYGPFALLPFIVLFLEPRVRAAWNQFKPDGGYKLAFACVYHLTWLSCVGLMVIMVVAWWHTNIHQEATVEGQFAKLRGSEMVDCSPIILGHNTSAQVYSRKELKQHGFDLIWKLISSNPVPGGTELSCTFDPGNPKSDAGVRDYKLTIEPVFYSQDIEIEYDRNQKRLILQNADPKLLHLIETDDTPSALSQFRPRSPRNYLTGLAYAEGPPPEQDISIALESNDILIRRQARNELAHQGTAALPWIQQILTDPKSSYRLRLGTIVALDRMPQADPTQLSTGALNSIVDASSSSDSALRDAARQFIISHHSWQVEAVVRQDLAEKQKENALGTVPREQVSELARTEFELLYNLGVMEKDLYGSKKVEDRARIDKSIKAFAQAWDLRSLAEPKDRLIYAKALYGWGLALHDRSRIERRNDNIRDPALVKSAQAKFQEFLQAVQGNDEARYPYPEQISHAKAYIANPVPRSLQDTGSANPPFTS